MSLRPVLEKILHLLAQNPSAEYQAKLKASAGKLESAAEAFAGQLELANVENSVSYAKLAGLLNDPTRKKIATLAWANAHLQRLKLPLLSGKSFTAPAKTQFVVRVLQANAGDDIINELGRSEEERLQDEFAQLARLSRSQAEQALRNLKPAKKLEAFCSANGIPVAKKKAKLDTANTHLAVFRALESYRDRQKL